MSSGTYNNASEGLREALHLKMQQDEIYQSKKSALCSVLIEGEESGEVTPLDMDAIILEAKIEMGNNA